MLKEEKLISVIIPVYNVEKYLERCIISVIKQTYKKLEIILVDDGSTDNSGILCDKIASVDYRIIVIHKKNGGLSSARNVGLEKASGDFVTFIDSDDWIELDTYAYMMNIIDKYHVEIVDIECQYAYSNYDPIRKTEENLEIYREKDVLWNYFDRGLRLQNSAPYSVWRKIYKKEVINCHTFPEGKNSEDLLFNYEVLKKTNSIAISHLIKYHYFQNTNGISVGPLKKADLGLLDICETICNKEMKNTYKGIDQLTRVKLARSYFSILARLATAGYNKNDFSTIKSIEKEMKAGLRRNLSLLIKSPIPMNRKALILIFCVDYKLIRIPYLILVKIKGDRI